MDKTVNLTPVTNTLRNDNMTDIKERLTESNVLELHLPEAGKNQTFYWSDDIKGLGLRVTANGARAYIVQARIRGTGSDKSPYRRVTLGPPDVFTYREAVHYARSVVQACYLGIDPVVHREFALHEIEKMRVPEQAPWATT
jgi:hypothetical protein